MTLNDMLPLKFAHIIFYNIYFDILIFQFDFHI